MRPIDAIEALYNGDFEKTKKILANTREIHIYTINSLVHPHDNSDHRMCAIPLIFKGEAEHPGQFSKYKKIVDYIARTQGVDSLIYNLNYSGYFKYGPDPMEKLTDLTDQIPISPQMKIYLRHLQVRSEPERRRQSTLLQAIRDNTKNASSKERQAIRITMRRIVQNYRQNHPKSLERDF